MGLGMFVDGSVREVTITLDSYNDLLFYKSFYKMAIHGDHNTSQKVWQAEWSRQNKESKENE